MYLEVSYANEIVNKDHYIFISILCALHRLFLILTTAP